MNTRPDTAIRRVTKRGDTYTVVGHSLGKVVSADVHAKYVEPRFGGSEEYALLRAVEMVRDYEG